MRSRTTKNFGKRSLSQISSLSQHVSSIRENHLKEGAENSANKKLKKLATTLCFCVTELGLWLATKAAESFSSVDADIFCWGNLDVFSKNAMECFCRHAKNLFSSYFPSGGQCIMILRQMLKQESARPSAGKKLGEKADDRDEGDVRGGRGWERGWRRGFLRWHESHLAGARRRRDVFARRKQTTQVRAKWMGLGRGLFERRLRLGVRPGMRDGGGATSRGNPARQGPRRSSAGATEMKAGNCPLSRRREKGAPVKSPFEFLELHF